MLFTMRIVLSNGHMRNTIAVKIFPGAAATVASGTIMDMLDFNECLTAMAFFAYYQF